LPSADGRRVSRWTAADNGDVINGFRQSSAPLQKR
jgi:phage gp37-like protein